MDLVPDTRSDAERQQLETARERLVHTWTTNPRYAGSGAHPRDFRVQLPPTLELGRRNERYDFFTLGPIASAHVAEWNVQAARNAFSIEQRGQHLRIGVPHSFYARQSTLPAWLTPGCVLNVLPFFAFAALCLLAAYGVGGGSFGPATYAAAALAHRHPTALGGAALGGLALVAYTARWRE